MGELVCLEINEQWSKMKRGIHMANTVSGPNTTGFRPTLRRAVVEIVERCRVQRKRVRDAEKPYDASDEAIVRAARFTDALPLASYDRILHLVPRLVNVVTVPL